LGLDEFLGQVTLPLNEMDVYESPRARWFKLQSKPGKDSKKERGDLEVKVGFVVKPGSLTDLSKKEKNKSSITNLMGGSLLSLGTLEKRKGLKKLAQSMGSKMHLSSKKKKKDKINDADSVNSGSFSSIGTPGLGPRHSIHGQTFGDADPGVISEDDDEFAFDNLSHKSSGSSLYTNRNQSQYQSPKHLPPLPSSSPPAQQKSNPFVQDTEILPPAPSKPPRSADTVVKETNTPPPQTKEKPKEKDEWETKLYGKQHPYDIGSTDSLKRRSWEPSRVVPLAATNNDVDSEHPLPEHYNNKSVPTTPNLSNIDEEHRVELRSKEAEDRPKPLPRQQNNFNDNFIENEKKLTNSTPNSAKIAEVKPSKHEKPEKPEKDNIFTKKLKMFRKDKSDSFEDIKLARAASRQQFNNGERVIIGDDMHGINGRTVEISPEILKRYEGKSREEVIKIAHNLENDMHIQKQRMKELEDYLDMLLLKVMENSPRILQNPYSKGNLTKR
jgi:FIP domain